MTAPDMTSPDAPSLDGAPLDQAPLDQAIPDQAIPDQTVPDQAMPDMPIPDQSVPDIMLPDAAAPYSVWKQANIPASFKGYTVAASGNVLLVGGSGKNSSGSFEGQIYWSTDGGQKWTQSNFNSTNGALYLAMDGTDAAVVSNKGFISVSSDSGKSFTNVSIPNAKYGSCWTLGQTASIAVHKGHVLTGGRNYVCWANKLAGPWTRQDLTLITKTSPIKARSSGVALATYGGKVVGLSVAYDGQSSGWHYAYRNDGMGTTWTDISDKLSITRAAPHYLTFASTGEAFALGYKGQFYKSKDGGQTWSTTTAGCTWCYNVAHFVPASGPTQVLVAAKTSRLSTNGGGLFSVVQGLPKYKAYFGSAAFDGAGRAYLFERGTISVTTSILAQGSP